MNEKKSTTDSGRAEPVRYGKTTLSKFSVKRKSLTISFRLDFLDRAELENDSNHARFSLRKSRLGSNYFQALGSIA